MLQKLFGGGSQPGARIRRLQPKGERVLEETSVQLRESISLVGKGEKSEYSGARVAPSTLSIPTIDESIYLSFRSLNLIIESIVFA